MVKLAAYLPNIERIEVLKREEVEGGVKLLNLWKGRRGGGPGGDPALRQARDDAVEGRRALV
jgi:hypothetical protein